MERGYRRERRVYGYDDNQYDPFLGGLFKSKHKKKKEKLDIQQRETTLNLTNTQNQIAAAKAQSEVFKAQAEQMRALAARKLAEKADTQLKGAKATTNLKYIGLGVAAIVLVGGIALIGMIMKQGKKSALISARLAKIKATK